MRVKNNKARRILAGALVLAGLAATGLVVPAIAADPAPVPHYLVFSGTYGWRHDGITEAKAYIAAMAREAKTFTVEFSEDPAVFNPATYQNIDGVILLQTTGLGGSSSPFTAQQKQDFINFFECGASLIGIHAAADSGGGWPEYDDLLGSSGFDFHPHLSLESRNNPLGREAFNPPFISDVVIQVEDHNHPATDVWAGTDTFKITDEIYRYKENPRDHGVHVLLSLDEESHYWRRSVGLPEEAGGSAPEYANPVSNPFNQVPETAMPDDTPIAWTKTDGSDSTHQASVFYTNLGHTMATWDRVDFREHLFGGITWASQTGPDRTCVSTKIGA